MKKYIISSVLLFCSLFMLSAAEQSVKETSAGVERYAIYIGSNYGGKGKEKLLYAGTDAQSFQKTMTEIGGIAEKNSCLLIDPSKNDVEMALDFVTAQIEKNKFSTKRSEFIFYYSGHSDENALLLGDNSYNYSELKAAITEVPSDVHVVILDSCYSGNFIRTKGGQKKKPFLFDDTSVVKGHAYLSSSSELESSQESDEIESSFFTNAVITGLRGAADTSGDNKVTLNELYSYAFNETLAKTEGTKAGPQHPNYNITLVGSGDLILSDISTSDTLLSIAKEAEGRFIIRDASGKLISEINKNRGQEISMALPVGNYSVVLIKENETKQGSFELTNDNVFVLDENLVHKVDTKRHKLRGGKRNDVVEEIKSEDAEVENEAEEVIAVEKELETSENVEEVAELEISEETPEDDDDFEITGEFRPFYFNFKASVVPELSWQIFDDEDVNISVGAVGTYDKVILGGQFSTIYNRAGTVYGGQYSSIFNIAENVYGGQFSSIFNYARKVEGVQFSALYNGANTVKGMQSAALINYANELYGLQSSVLFNATKINKGVQIGLINYCDDAADSGVSIGLFNICKNGLMNLSYSIDNDGMTNIEMRSGADSWYTIMGIGMPQDYIEGKIVDKDDVAASLWVGFGEVKHMTQSFYWTNELIYKYVLSPKTLDFDFFDNVNLGYRLALNLDIFHMFTLYGGAELGWGKTSPTYEVLHHETRWDYNMVDSYSFNLTWFFGLKWGFHEK